MIRPTVWFALRRDAIASAPHGPTATRIAVVTHALRSSTERTRNGDAAMNSHAWRRSPTRT
jgi:hypothetical protein